MPEIEEAFNTIHDAWVKAGEVAKLFLDLDKRGPYMFNEGRIQEIKDAEEKAVKFISFVKQEILEEKEEENE